jgi:hypothetical protein
MVVSPDPTGTQNQCVELLAVLSGEGYGDSNMFIPINDPLAAGYREVTVSFDLYTPSPGAESVWGLTWWWDDPGTYTLGTVWSDEGMVYPLLAGAAPAVFDRWTNLTMRWDFASNTVSSWYDGLPVDVAVPMPTPPDITALTGWWIDFLSVPYDFEAEDAVWIDNFSITVDKLVPEPSVFLLAGLGLMALLRRKK